MNSQQIMAIQRPHPRLLTYYLILACVFPPFSLVALPVLYFRYHTMRYRFDDEGVSMSWGFLFRHQVNLTYSRIQDIHLTSGLIQRWLGLADVHIQTASGNSTAEMKIEGILEYEQIRDFLYSRMRGYRERGVVQSQRQSSETAVSTHAEQELVAIMNDIRTELRQVRETLQARDEGAEKDVVR